MSDAAQRAELESLQVSTPRLALRLADFPAVGEERAALEREAPQLREALAALEQRLAESEAHELRLLDRRDTLQRAGGRLRGLWWMSRFAPLAVVLGLGASFLAIAWLLDSLNWPYWAERLGPWLLPLVPAVNLARLGLSRLQHRRREAALLRARSPGRRSATGR